MLVKVLGSAAGGGFPQWNCACRNCIGVRSGSLRAKSRTQAQLALKFSSEQSILINASPDLRTQVLSWPALNPVRAPRHSPISGVLLTSADVDAVAGLLHLREFQPLEIYATPSVRRILKEENRIFGVLNRAKPPAIWRDIPVNKWFPLTAAGTGDQAVCCSALSLGGSFPDYVSEDLRRTLAPEEAVIGVTISRGNKKMFYAPSLPGPTAEWKELARASDLCILDGTFWTDQELIAAGGSAKTAREIGHIPLSGADGMLEQFGRAGTGQRVLMHINNTNPILDEDSAECAEVRRRGWQVAYDGMEFEL